ncbi:MAG TPA: ABC transporter permease subunit [Acidimicrobiales bacterium]|nr:ABC transporter permease subunit [Acidimicrobiales bacterium]
MTHVDQVDRTSRPPLWRDVRVLSWAFQLAVLAIVVAIVVVLASNVQANSERLGIPTGWDYLDNPAQFPIPDSDFDQRQPLSDAIVLGFFNTLRVALVGIVLATVLGTIIGVARLSGNWLVRALARVYVEILRNVPLLYIIVFSYIGIALATFPRIESAWEPLGLAVVSNRGLSVPWLEGSAGALLLTLLVAGLAAFAAKRWRDALSDRTGVPARSLLWSFGVALAVMVAGTVLAGATFSVPDLDGRLVSGGIRLSPEFFAILFALVIYTASHIAEIVRGSIQAVPKGQNEAAEAIALTSTQRLRFVVLPQAFRIAVPPLGNQYLNLTKNSTLGTVVSYYELAQVTRIGIANGAPAVPSWLLTLGIFLALSLVLSALVNIVNRRLALVES